MSVCPSVSPLHFVCPPGTNIFHTQWGGQTFSTHSWGDNIFHTQGGQTFLYMGGTNIFVGAGGGGYDVDDHEEEEEDVSEANIVMSEVSKLSAGSQA